MLEVLFIGLSLGSILLLVALGLAITYGAMGVINMAHGEMVMIGAYVTVLSGIWLGTNIFVAIPLAFIVTALIGLLIERVVVRRLYGRLLDTLLATWGIAILIQQAVEKAAEITPVAIREAVKGQEFDAPNGHVKIEPENLHTYLTPRIAQWLPDGQGKIIDAYKEPVIPLPYVAYGETPTNLFCTGKGLETSKLNKT